MHFDEVLDVGYDYGATGGHGWATQVIAYPNGRTRRNMDRSVALGAWELGNRNVDLQTLETLRGFFHAMRGRAHSFLYKDWNDYLAIQQPLEIDGGLTTQLTKTYGLSINPWVRDILKPDPSTVVIEVNQGTAGWETLEAGVDYELDPSTGIVTWDVAPDTGAEIRWTGKFWVPVRFDSDIFDAQFLGIEEREDGDELAYHIGGLPLIEEPEPEDAEE